MAQPKTQDNQKVFQSTLEKFSSFVGGVENVSSSKNMSEIYDNMTKLFDVFTRGALTAQGANSEILLRNVYRSLNDDFFKIIQDTDAVEKIAEVMKDKQESIKPEEADKALVSETTKKVVKQTLDPNDCDPMSVILDFTDELQTAILQVKLNLSREYERRKLEHAKSIEGQQEDIDRLNSEFREQNDIMVSALDEMSKEQTDRKDEDLEALEELLEKFDGISDDSYFKDGTDNISSDIESVEKSLSKVKFQPDKVAKNIQSTSKKKGESATKKVEKKPESEGKKSEPLKKAEKPAKSQEKKKSDSPKPPEKKQEPRKHIETQKPTEQKKPAAPSLTVKQPQKKIKDKPPSAQKPVQTQTVQKQTVQEKTEETPSVQKQPEEVVWEQAPIDEVKEQPTVEEAPVEQEAEPQVKAEPEKKKENKPVSTPHVKPVVAKPPQLAKPNVNDLNAIKVQTIQPEMVLPVQKPPSSPPLKPAIGGNPPTASKTSLTKFKVIPRSSEVKKSISKIKSTSEKPNVSRKFPLVLKNLPKKEQKKNPVSEFGIGKLTSFFNIPLPKAPEAPKVDEKKIVVAPVKPVQSSKPLFRQIKPIKPLTKGRKTGPVRPIAPLAAKSRKKKDLPFKSGLRKSGKTVAQKGSANLTKHSKKKPELQNMGLAKFPQRKKKVKHGTGMLPKSTKEHAWGSVLDKGRKKKTKPKKSNGPIKTNKVFRKKERTGKGQISDLTNLIPSGLVKASAAKKKGGKKKSDATGVLTNVLSMGKKGEKGKSVGKKIGKSQIKPITPTKTFSSAKRGTRLGGKPDGKTCTCPLCGNVHQHGNVKPKGVKGGVPAKGKPALEKKKPEQQPDQNNQNDLSSEKVQETLGLMGKNVIRLAKDKKFRRNFEMNYKPIQKNMQKQMQKNNEDEEESHRNFEKTKDGIKKLKNAKGNSSLLQKILFLGTMFVNLIWIVIGGVIIITLLRKGWQMWKKAYMPKVKSDPSTFTIFGFKIPIAGEIIDAFTGIKNFITVGLPNWWTRISTTFGKFKESLFGKKGHLRDFEQTKATLWRLAAAWFVGQTKQAVGTVAKWLGKILSFIPFVGPILQFLCELIPEVYAFIVNRLMKEWANGQAEAERAEKRARSVSDMKQIGSKKKIRQLATELLKKSAKIKPIAPPEAIPFLQTPKKASKVRKPMAIMRHVSIKNYHPGEGSAYGKNATDERTKSIEEWGGLEWDHDTKKYNKFVVGKQQEKGSKHYNRVENAILTTDRTLQGKTLFEKLLILSQEPWKPTKRERVSKIISPEIRKLVRYQVKLGRFLESRYSRVANEPLYDPEKGWNPHLRVTARDLVTRIPFEPYREMTDSPVGYGTEAEPEERLKGDGYGKGYMPFKWKWNGRVIVRDPYEWELFRTFVAISAWDQLKNLVSGPSTWWKGATVPPERLIDIVLGNMRSFIGDQELFTITRGSDKEDWRLEGGFMKMWAQRGDPYDFNPMGDVDSQNKFSEGLFPTFYREMVKGRWNREGLKVGNIFQMANITRNLSPEDMAKIQHARKYGISDKNHYAEISDESDAWERKFLSIEKGGGFNSNVFKENSKGYNDTVAKYYSQNGIQKFVSLGHTDDSQKKIWSEEKWDNSFKLGTGRNERRHKIMRIYAGDLLYGQEAGGHGEARNEEAYKRLEKHFHEIYEGKSSGKRFKFHEFLQVIKGVQLGKIYSGGRAGRPYMVTNPILKAGNILARMTHDVFFIPKYSGQKAYQDHFYSLIHHLLDFMNLKLAPGVDKRDLYEQFVNDKEAKNVISRLILQYFFSVWRKWNQLESALKESMLKMDNKSYKKFKDVFNQLGQLFELENILKYLANHIRLPNAKVNVIDYPNATKQQISILDKYRLEAKLRPLQDKKAHLQTLDTKYNVLLAMTKNQGGSIKLMPKQVNDAMRGILGELKTAEWEYKYTGDSWYRDALLDRHSQLEDLANTVGILVSEDAKITSRPDGYVKTVGAKLTPDQRQKMRKADEKKRKEEDEKRKLEEAAKRRQRQKALTARREWLAVQEAKNKMLEKMRKDEENYQSILQKLTEGTKVSEEDMKALGKEVANVKQEAENKIAKLPREERELKLALIRGDTVSEKTLVELKDTASGLQMSLQDYMMEVRKIPSGSIVGVQSVPTGQTKVVNTQDTEAVDLAS